MPLNIVMDDLRMTRSVDFTIENILEGRLQAPPVSMKKVYKLLHTHICLSIKILQSLLDSHLKIPLKICGCIRKLLLRPLLAHLSRRLTR